LEMSKLFVDIDGFAFSFAFLKKILNHGMLRNYCESRFDVSLQTSRKNKKDLSINRRRNLSTGDAI